MEKHSLHKPKLLPNLESFQVCLKGRIRANAGVGTIITKQTKNKQVVALRRPVLFQSSQTFMVAQD